jgi:hypothetical protein
MSRRAIAFPVISRSPDEPTCNVSRPCPLEPPTE